MPSDLYVTLIGLSGVGKSTTGNSILGRPAFRNSSDTNSVTIEPQRESTVLADGRTLHVLDTPLYNDEVKAFVGLERTCFPWSFHAFLLVFRFGSKVHYEDLHLFQLIRENYGERFIEERCAIVIAFGDYFPLALEDDGIFTLPFLDWCNRQTGVFQIIFQQVHKRIILFDNKASPEVKEEQRKGLIAMLNDMTVSSREYTDIKFKEAMERIEALDKRVKEFEMKSCTNRDVNSSMMRSGSQKRSLHVTLVGHVGAGKSSTGNTLLRRRAFETSSGRSGCTTECRSASTELPGGRTLQVLDTPGLGTNTDSNRDTMPLITDTMRGGLPTARRVVVPVLSFVSRFTDEDLQLFQLLTSTFNLFDDFLQKHCVVVVCFGDRFLEAEEDGDIPVSFPEWFRRNGDAFRDIFDRCQGRVLLFNNIGTEEAKDRHSQELIAMVDRMVDTSPL